MSTSPDIEALVSRLARLPGLGPRSARRATLALLQKPQTRLYPLVESLQIVARNIQTCTECGNLDSCNPCSLCADPGRKADIICVVETVADLWALERAGIHKGLYQVLGGTLSPLAGIGPEDLMISGLIQRVESGEVKEVILALGATVDGATTAHWLQNKLAALVVEKDGTKLSLKISRLGHGMPMGGALDSLDDGTLTAALIARKEL